MYDNSENDYLKQQYAAARNKYKPSHIKTLLIAEAPPNNIDRYFYFEDVKSHDSLFLEIMGILYPDLKKRYLAKRRDTELKQELLENFKEDGYWLMNLSELPMGLFDIAAEDLLPSLIKRLERHIEKSTPIILIKANFFDMAYPVLLAKGYHVINERLPFPGSGQQGVFRTKFKKALQSC